MKEAAGWLLQRITGVLLIAGLALHFAIMHFSGEREISYAFVMKRLSDPIWQAFDIAFLLTAIYHGFAGFWGLATEYIGSKGLLGLSRGVIIVCASGLAFAGIYIVRL